MAISSPMYLLAVAALTATACSTPRTKIDFGESEVLTSESGIAIGGYDPVAYFEDGQAMEGHEGIQVDHHGATYRFTSTAHRSSFTREPERYAPAYGGWCAWALADGEGELVEIDPESWVIQDGRLLLFYDGFLADTREKWLDGDVKGLERTADENWQRVRSR